MRHTIFLISVLCYCGSVVPLQNRFSPAISQDYSQYKANLLQGYAFSDFQSSMYTAPRYKQYYERIIKEENSELQFIKLAASIYNALLANLERAWEPFPKIPKIIHQIWLGPKPFPEKYKVLRDSWIDQHPGWAYKLWTDADIAQFNLINKEFYHKTPSWAEKANLLRYEVLYRFGGLYIDTDYECLKSLDFLHHCCDFYAGLEYAPSKYNGFIIGNALIATKPEHFILAMLIQGVRDKWDRYEPWSRINQLERSGTRHFTNTVKQLVPVCDGINVVFPSNVFYPYTGKTIVVPKEALGIHYWDATWLKDIKIKMREE